MHSKCTTHVEINNVRIEFTSKKMTAYGGFSLLAAFFEKINLRGMLQEVVPIRESSPNGMGIYSKVLGYILMIYAGGSRFSHVLYLGWQDAFAGVFGVKRLPMASTTLGRLFKKIRKLKEVEEMSEGLWGYVKGLIPWEEIKEDWLTFDSAVLERYGKQEGAKRGYNPKKKGRGSHSPLLAFLNRSKYVVHLWNRPGNVMSWNNIIGFFESTWQRIHGHIVIKGIIADSEFYLMEFLEVLERRELVYIIAVRLYRPLQRMVYAQQHWRQIEDGIGITEFFFQHLDWMTDRIYIAVRQDIKRRPHAMDKALSLFGNDINTGTYRYSVWITNSQDPAYEVWKHCRPRANDENTIKELKEDFAVGGFSMKYFYSTEAAMLMRVLIYNLFVLFRHQILGQTERIERLKTLRYKYFVLPAQLGGDSRTPVLRILVFTQKVRSKLLYLYHRIEQYFPPAYGNCTAFE